VSTSTFCKRFPALKGASSSGTVAQAVRQSLFLWDDLKCPPLSGCGTQHPHRALGGTCVLLAAAPTTSPCFPLLSPAVTSSPGAGEVFAHWRRSSLLHSGHIQRKIYFNFVVQESLRTFLNHIFTGRVVKENYICNTAFGLVNPCYQYFRFYNSSVLYYNEVIAFIPLIYRRNLPCW